MKKQLKIAISASLTTQAAAADLEEWILDNGHLVNIVTRREQIDKAIGADLVIYVGPMTRAEAVLVLVGAPAVGLCASHLEAQNPDVLGANVPLWFSGRLALQKFITTMSGKVE